MSVEYHHLLLVWFVRFWCNKETIADGEPWLWCKLCENYIDGQHLSSDSHKGYADYERAARKGA